MRKQLRKAGCDQEKNSGAEVTDSSPWRGSIT